MLFCNADVKRLRREIVNVKIYLVSDVSAEISNNKKKYEVLLNT